MSTGFTTETPKFGAHAADSNASPSAGIAGRHSRAEERQERKRIIRQPLVFRPFFSAVPPQSGGGDACGSVSPCLCGEF
jgi:hypothetical protein